MLTEQHSKLVEFIWSIAERLRGPYRPPQYERVMLPLVVLRRFDCVLADTKEAVVAEAKRRAGGKIEGDALDADAGTEFSEAAELWRQLHERDEPAVPQAPDKA